MLAGVSWVSWRTFLAVCRCGSLSAAALELGYTQSAVSRQVAALEREVGAALLHRQARGVEPTAAGIAFLRHATVAVNEADRALRSARSPDPVRRLAIGATPSLATWVAPAAVRRFLAADPGWGWTLVPGLTRDLHTRVADGELDVALVTDAPPGLPHDDRVRSIPLGADAMVVVVAADHPLAGRRRVRIEELAEEVWAEDNDGSRALLRRHAARAGVDPKIDLDAADLAGKVALAATGHAVALVPGITLATLRPDVVGIPLVDAPVRGLHALVPTGGDHEGLARFVGILEDLLGEVTTPGDLGGRTR
ncbi:LysR family transcriptional regulator [Nocardioides sp. CCNWLW239]|uniref:LysR family transcriptional regulator n=1 Tax=Nocardioides sp. CCNWLW239 TaxID=3128902 RepID=UPI0030185C7C